MTQAFQMRLSILLTAMLLLGPGYAYAQQSPAPREASKSLLENDQVKVKEMRFRPGMRIGPESYPNSFIYPLTDGTLVFTPTGKTPFEMTFKAGEALWIPSQSTTTANETDKEIRALVVEIKAGRGAAKEKAKKASKSGSKKAAKGSAAAKAKKKS